MAKTLVRRIMAPTSRSKQRGQETAMMNHDETIAIAEQHRHGLLSDAADGRVGRRARRTAGPSLRVLRRRSARRA
jgi:hypothetical protein